MTLKIGKYFTDIGLSTSCSRFPKKLRAICQVAQKLLKKSQKLLFVTKVAQKLLKKQIFLLLLSSLEKCANLPNKSKISKLRFLYNFAA